MELGFNLQLYETARCTAPDGTALLNVDMARNRLGVWRVEVREIGGRTIDTTYSTETDARRAVELAYAYGRQTGRWHIQRRQGYTPDANAGHVSPAGIDDHHRADAENDEHPERQTAVQSVRPDAHHTARRLANEEAPDPEQDQIS